MSREHPELPEFEKTVYLGDGAYAGIAYNQVWVYTERQVNPYTQSVVHYVALDFSALELLQGFAKDKITRGGK